MFALRDANQNSPSRICLARIPEYNPGIRIASKCYVYAIGVRATSVATVVVYL